MKKGRGLHTQKLSWGLKGEAPSTSFPESHTIQSPELLWSLYFLREGQSVPIAQGICECEIHGDISSEGLELHRVADCLRASQWCSGVQHGAEEVHGLLAVWVPATVSLQREKQKVVRVASS